MTLTRRGFLAGAASGLVPAYCQTCAPPAGGTPLPFSIPAGQTNVQRKAISALTATEVNRLRLAYRALRNLTNSNANDPRGWMQQANVHCFQCGGNPAGSDIHQSWFFLPWHRAYLYYHERILGRLINDMSFRLPFWDWDLPASRNLPPIYRPQTVSSQPNSLFDNLRDTNGGQAMPASIFPANSNPMNSPNFPTFGGSASSGGSLENTIHGLVHVWTAHRPMTQARADMGRLNTAARDPIFFKHHCNIDRLWAEWLRRNPVARQNPTALAWLDRAFTFFDENSRLRSIRVRDVLNTATNLGYNYAPGAALTSSAAPKRFDLTASQQQVVKLTAELKKRLLTPSDLNVTRSLVVEDAKVPTATGLYNVFAGAPPAAGTEASEAPNYLGYIAVIVGEHAHAARPASLILDPKKAFADMASTSEGAFLTYAPAGAAQGTRLSFSSVYIIEQ
ncbi:MAG: hypothetical protein FJW20_00230 [Acidimicrobiia bacterium]|nr:hypothetical protein [Acidimicrobiia bacterium]